jgi:hypothetical protein
MRSITLVAPLALAALLGAAPADATVSIALQEAGFNGGARTTVASAPDFAVFAGLSYGTFIVNSIFASDITNLLDSVALDVSSATHGEIKIYVTATGQLGGNDFISGLTANISPPGWTETLTTWLDPNNAAFAQTVALGAASFSAIGSDTDHVAYSPPGLYSVTGIYDIVSSGIGTSDLTIHVESATVSEPASIALLGASLIGACVALRRRRSVA